MKKIIALSLIIGLGVLVLGPTLVGATDGPSITTSLTRSTGGGAAPIIKAKWEMNGPWEQRDAQTGELITGLDDSSSAGAQFLPEGKWGDRNASDDGEKHFSICAIVTDPDGVADIDGVYTDWYYPSDTAFHHEEGAYTLYSNLPVPDDEIGGGTNSKPDYGIYGCALPVTDENELHKLSKEDGIKLFCDNIKNGNNNLPTFFGDYSYDEICGETGELEKETAYVYCADKVLEWEDPAGDYTVDILALDKAGVSSVGPNDNTFEYLPLTAFEVDFTSIDYGDVKLNVHKRISGDRSFATTTPDGRPTVRNTGNTRLYMWVEQDDMGFGTTDGLWNIKYDARVGNNEADWKNYKPKQHRKLEDILDLSEIEEMDFSVEVSKFPSNGPFSGQMWLDASKANFRECKLN
jgi:hypothetical protein